MRFQLTAHNWVSVTPYLTDTEAAITVDSPSPQTTTPAHSADSGTYSGREEDSVIGSQLSTLGTVGLLDLLVGPQFQCLLLLVHPLLNPTCP